MATCSRCGNPIEFRYIDGRCIPLHLWGGCTEGGGAAKDFSGYSRSEESCCFCTTCPKCGCDVYFIRHNGGSVWIDPPLGPPWHKHPCMDQAPERPIGVHRNNLVLEQGLYAKKYPDDAVLGVVKESRVSFSKRGTIIKLETEEKSTHLLCIKNNAGFLTGKLVVYLPSSRMISVFADDAHQFAVIASIRPSVRLIFPL